MPSSTLPTHQHQTHILGWAESSHGGISPSTDDKETRMPCPWELSWVRWLSPHASFHSIPVTLTMLVDLLFPASDLSINKDEGPFQLKAGSVTANRSGPRSVWTHPRAQTSTPLQAACAVICSPCISRKDLASSSLLSHFGSLQAKSSHSFTFSSYARARVTSHHLLVLHALQPPWWPSNWCAQCMSPPAFLSIWECSSPWLSSPSGGKEAPLHRFHEKHTQQVEDWQCPWCPGSQKHSPTNTATAQASNRLWSGRKHFLSILFQLMCSG